MPKKPANRARALYIGQWIIRLGRQPVEVAKGLGINEGYLSQLISGKKNNPSALLLLRISEFLGITVNDLYRDPPPKLAIEATRKLAPRQIVALGDLLDELEDSGRK